MLGLKTYNLPVILLKEKEEMWQFNSKRVLFFPKYFDGYYCYCLKHLEKMVLKYFSFELCDLVLFCQYINKKENYKDSSSGQYIRYKVEIRQI